MKNEKIGWFVFAFVVMWVAVITLAYVGVDLASAYGIVLSAFVAVMFAELMGLEKK